MENYKEIEIDKIKPDPKNPITSTDELELREMAQSIATTGIINPIEIDKNFVIITGFRRWRAAKIAGLKTVPVKIIDIDEDDRLIRQVVENIHQKTMDDIDMAHAFKKLISISAANKDGDTKQSHTPLTGPTADKGITRLSEQTGISRASIVDKLNILEQPKEWQKAVKESKDSGKFTSALIKTPEQFKKVVEKKFLDGEFVTRDGAREFASALKREEANPQVIKKLLEIDYSKLRGFHEVEQVVTKISPRDHVVITKAIFEPSQEVSKIIDLLREWAKRNPRISWNPMQVPRIIANLSFGKNLLEELLTSEGKKLLGKTNEK